MSCCMDQTSSEMCRLVVAAVAVVAAVVLSFLSLSGASASLSILSGGTISSPQTVGSESSLLLRASHLLTNQRQGRARQTERRRRMKKALRE